MRHPVPQSVLPTVRLFFNYNSYVMRNIIGQHIIGLGHQELAGVYRETVTNTLGEFKEAGLTGLSRKKVMVLNR